MVSVPESTPLFMTIPLMVLTDVGAVMAPVLSVPDTVVF